VCFAFNGGPGSASVWLHLGALGPKRIQVNDDGSMPAPPYAVSDNPHSWFEHFDLVFVDPPHTGYSIAASEDARTKLLGVDGDVEALAEVMRAWLARNKRWSSPIYLAGESYGTTRGAALADRLQSLGVALSGLILVSCAMDLQSIVFAPHNDLPYALFLPAFAGVAQYHGKLKGTLAKSPEAARRAAEAFVEDGLSARPASRRRPRRQGARPRRPPHRRADRPRAGVRRREEPARRRLRLLLRAAARRRPHGRPARCPRHRADGGQAHPRLGVRSRDRDDRRRVHDGRARLHGSELGLVTTERYEILSMEVHEQWNWNRGKGKGNSYASTSGDLARAMRRNPHMKVLVASGHYDLGTPYSASNWSLAQLDAPPEVLARSSTTTTTRGT
jgi:carboxypeptidase C (cathepsin A)